MSAKFGFTFCPVGDRKISLHIYMELTDHITDSTNELSSVASPCLWIVYGSTHQKFDVWPRPNVIRNYIIYDYYGTANSGGE